MEAMRFTQVRFAAATLLLAALVVAIGAWASLPPVAYPTLVGLGVLATLGAVAVSEVEWSVVFAVGAPWFVVLLPPSQALAFGLLVGGAIGVLAMPVVLRFGEFVESVAG